MEFQNLMQPFTEEDKKQGFMLIQELILKKQSESTPFFIGRLSGNESCIVGKMLSNQKSTISSGLVQNMLFGAGIQFKSSDHYVKYVKQYNRSVSKCDLLGIWSESMYVQAKEYYEFIGKIYPKMGRICAQSLEPYYYMDDPNYHFQDIFANKKVLIITSHEITTRNQLNHIDKIFGDKSIFHESTTFHIYKPPQQNGGNHDDEPWTTHFEQMKVDIRRLREETFDFDIALVSCGGFGMIISEFIFTDLSKSAIYVGGCLQLFFGIMGSRWQHSLEINARVNEYWTRPMDEDKPKHPNLCEGNCYW